MKKISQLLWGAVILLTTTLTYAQSGITVEASQLYASFNFTDSQGTKLNKEYAGIFTGAYNVGYRYVSLGGFMARGGVGMRNAGANTVYDNMNYSWRLQYLDTKVGLGYFYELTSLNVYMTANGYFAYMLRGNQTLNNENFNITQSGLMSRNDYGFSVTPGVDFDISDIISTNVEFSYLMGLANLETETTQKSANYAFGLTVGLTIALDAE